MEDTPLSLRNLCRVGRKITDFPVAGLSQIFLEGILPGAKTIQAQPFEATIFKHRITRSSHFGGEFVGRSDLEIHFGMGGSEQLAGKIVPGATAFTGSVIEAIGIA